MEEKLDKTKNKETLKSGKGNVKIHTFASRDAKEVLHFLLKDFFTFWAETLKEREEALAGMLQSILAYFFAYTAKG